MTLEEIKKAISENKDLAKGVAVFVTAETESGKELLADHAKAQVEKAVKESEVKIYTDLDNSLFEILGVRKGADQKTTDLLKEIAGEHKALKEKEALLNNDEKIKDLNAQIKKMQDDGSVNEHWKKIYDDAVTKWGTEKEELQTQIAGKEEEFLNITIEADLRAGLGALTLREDVPQEAIDALVDKRMAEEKKTAKIIDGKVVYHKESGEPYLGEDYKPVKPSDIWKEVLGGLVVDADSSKSSGGGANPTLEQGKAETIKGKDGKEVAKITLQEGSFSTKQEFYDLSEKALREAGVESNSTKYVDAMKIAKETYDVDSLPMS